MSDASAPIPSSPRRIAIIGAGQIGSTFAFQLVRDGGHMVSVVARAGSPRLAQLQRDGAIVDRDGTRADVRVLDALDEDTPYDLVIVTLLAHQVDAVLPALSRSAATVSSSCSTRSTPCTSKTPLEGRGVPSGCHSSRLNWTRTAGSHRRSVPADRRH